MCQLKRIVVVGVFCLLLCSIEVYAVAPDEANSQKQDAGFSLDAIFKSLDGAINGLGNALGDTADGLGRGLDGAVNGLGNALGDTADGLGNAVNGLGRSLDETVCGLGNFLEDTGEFVGEVAEVAAVVGILYLFIAADVHYYHHGHHSFGH